MPLAERDVHGLRGPAADGTAMEVEAKVALPSPDAVRQALRRLGASAGTAAEEEDTFYAHPARDLVARDEALRVRRGASGWELTFKGPRQGGAYKGRAERTVRTPDDPEDFLRGLGFEPTVRIRKTRERHRLAAVEVAIDHVDGLGWFVEVEALAREPGAAEAAVRAALRELGLQDEPLVQRSYVELAAAAGLAADAREPRE